MIVHKLEEINRALDALQVEHDSGLLAAALSVRGAEIYRMLRAVGRESPASLTQVFNLLLDMALEAPKREVKVVVLDEGRAVTRQ